MTTERLWATAAFLLVGAVFILAITFRGLW